MSRQFSRVAVLKGGVSAEREVSLRSGRAVAAALARKGHDVAELDVTTRAVDLPAGVEAVFIALHGEFGEDGGVQALLDARGIPYTGPGAEASRIAFDKELTRARCEAHGVPVARGVVLTGPAAACPLPFPVVVKPTRQGSSVGCHRVREAPEWPAALADALQYGPALVEACIEGRELTVGVVGGEVLPVVEICAPGGYYDFDAKYTYRFGKTEYICPAVLDPAVEAGVRAAARGVFEAVGARGMGRVDFRLDGGGRFYALEINTIPGFTETSLLPKAAAAAGLPFDDLCERILNLAACG